MTMQYAIGRGNSLAAGVAALALTLALGCGRTEVVSVDGSSTVFLISGAAAEEFHEAEPGINVVVGKSGTGGGFKKFAAGEIDVCGASRKITDDEVAACEAAGIDFVELEIAFDGLAVVVNPENDWCDSLTVEQLQSIWREESEGTIMKWSDVDPEWPELDFELYGPGDDSGTFDYFTQVINGEEKNSRDDYSPSEDDNALVTGVAGDKAALGYFGYGYYAENTDKLKLLAIDAGEGPVLPNPEKVRDGSYHPLSRPLFIYVRTSALARPEVAKFVDFYLDHAAELAPQVGYVAVPDEVAREGRERLDAALKGETTAAAN
jgi:phosphate transport system substrate-binding protein